MDNMKRLYKNSRYIESLKPKKIFSKQIKFVKRFVFESDIDEEEIIVFAIIGSEIIGYGSTKALAIKSAKKEMMRED